MTWRARLASWLLTNTGLMIVSVEQLLEIDANNYQRARSEAMLDVLEELTPYLLPIAGRSAEKKETRH